MERRSPMPPGLQWNLPLLAAPPFHLPPDPQRELALALMELLIQAARQSPTAVPMLSPSRGAYESQTDNQPSGA